MAKARVNLPLGSNPAKGILVLDSTPIYAGILQGGMDDKCFTTEEILGEISHIRALRGPIETRVASGILTVTSASPDSIKRVKKLGQKLGELKISDADISVLALTLDLKESGHDATLISDDFAIQNLANSFSLPYSSYNSKGIKREITWVLYCPACGKTVDRASNKVCPVCGSSLKRRPKN